MKKILPFLFILLSVSVYSQSSVAGYIGFGSSAFDFEDVGLEPEDQAGYVPIGVQITLGEGMLQFGGEISYSAVPFTWEFEQNGTKAGEIKINQLFAGGFLRVNIGNEKIQPYAKAGGGAYMGKLEIEPEEGFTIPGDNEIDFKTAFGFYISGGVDIKIGKTLAIFGEIPFHIVERKLDVDGVDDDDAPSITANNWAIIAGIRILFK